MSENTKAFIDALQTGDNMAAGDAFKDALRDKVATSLDQARVDIAKNIFNGTEAEHISDPKPEYAGPNDRTDAIFDDQGQQIEFEPNNNPQPEAEAPANETQ